MCFACAGSLSRTATDAATAGRAPCWRGCGHAPIWAPGLIDADRKNYTPFPKGSAPPAGALRFAGLQGALPPPVRRPLAISFGRSRSRPVSGSSSPRTFPGFPLLRLPAASTAASSAAADCPMGLVHSLLSGAEPQPPPSVVLVPPLLGRERKGRSRFAKSSYDRCAAA
jgi:hypothetical protein